MKKNLQKNLRLYAVTDRRWLQGGESLASVVNTLLEAGVTAVQLREKSGDTETVEREATELLPLCRRFGVPLIINDNPMLAAKLGADGVHLGQEDMSVERARALLGEAAIIGATAHTVAEAVAAYEAGADYLGCGAVFGSDTKAGASRLALSELSAICRAVPIPVVAIGGITAENIRALQGSGIAGAAVVSALFAAKNKRAAVSALLRGLRAGDAAPQPAARLAEDTVAAEESSASGECGAAEKGDGAEESAAPVPKKRTEQLPTVLTIAGSDPSGGAGLQADLKTMTVHGVYGMSAVTALTVQNTCGVSAVYPVTAEQLREQIDAVCTDIMPDAVKIGMMFSAPLMRTAAERLQFYGAKHVVLDPVMVSTSGHRLMCEEAEKALIETLFPLAELITPNLPETEALLSKPIRTKAEMEEAAAALSARVGGGNVLIKGGHLQDSADDLLYLKGGRCLWLAAKRIDNPNSHGTGCTLSSAIASNLALGYPLEAAVRRAKAYLTQALAAGLNLGKGSGPLNHMAGRAAAETQGRAEAADRAEAASFENDESETT